MSSDCDHLWLLCSLDIGVLIQLSNAFGCLIPIEERHVAIHKDQAIPVRLSILNCLQDLWDGLLAVVGEGGQLFPVFDAKDHQEAKDDVAVESLVIHDEDLALLAG